ncbi:MAG: ribbon-helix-helix domain-containing protein [Chroococcidiopsidaceae cyanobacterium CP_BM_RX_35]|nr:ribbon-helix-helix domain-containing protein [Chroococcidiopsidaceae cyanobacterium CP_BM_RX_35]
MGKSVVKTAISLPESIFEEAEALAQQLGMSRSELYTEALKAYLRRYSQEQIFAKLNEVYSREPSELDPLMAELQFMSLPHEDW